MKRDWFKMVFYQAAIETMLDNQVFTYCLGLEAALGTVEPPRKYCRYSHRRKLGKVGGTACGSRTRRSDNDVSNSGYRA